MKKNWKTYSGNSPSTRQMYCFCTCRFLIWCSICLAFFGLLPNNNNPDVNRSNRWIVRKFFKLYSLARIKTTVLWRYRPHGWTWNIFFQVLKVNFLSVTQKTTLLNNNNKKSSLRNKKRSNLFVKKLFFHQKKKLKMMSFSIVLLCLRNCNEWMKMVGVEGGELFIAGKYI